MGITLCLRVKTQSHRLTVGKKLNKNVLTYSRNEIRFWFYNIDFPCKKNTVKCTKNIL